MVTSQGTLAPSIQAAVARSSGHASAPSQRYLMPPPPDMDAACLYMSAVCMGAFDAATVQQAGTALHPAGHQASDLALEFTTLRLRCAQKHAVVHNLQPFVPTHRGEQQPTPTLPPFAMDSSAPVGVPAHHRALTHPSTEHAPLTRS